MKRRLYIGAFIFLGLLISTLIHAGFEMWVLSYVTADYEAYAEVFWWQNWELAHGVVSAGLWLLGIVLGYLGGVRYWNILYVEKRYGTPKF
jgi:cell division protein FtsX